MAVNKAKKKEEQEAQIKLVSEDIGSKQNRLSAKLAQFYIKEHEIESVKGSLKQLNNELKTLKEELKRLAIDVESGQLGFLLDEDEDDLDGRVMDQSNIKKAEELRHTPHSEDDEEEEE